MYVHGIVFDKRAMTRGEPTSRTEKVDPLAVVNQLAKLLHEKGQQQKEEIELHEWEPIPESELDGSGKAH